MSGPRPGDDTAFFGHPKGLLYIALTEGAERFSYYSMQTLLVLYMVKHLLVGGHAEAVWGLGWLTAWRYHGLGGQPLASAIFGDYASLVFLTPILGGWLADRWLGRRAALLAGSAIMALGHALMAFEGCFIIAMALMIVGVGLFKGNIASQLGELYQPDDPRRAMGFQVFYIALNLAVIVAPLISGTMGERLGWHWGFGAAGVVMLAGLVLYHHATPWLPPQRRAAPDASPTTGLTRADWPRLAAIGLLIPAQAMVLLINMQIYNAYMVWVDARFALSAFGWTIPTSWVVTLDAAISFPMLLGVIAFWRWHARTTGKETDELTRMIIGGLFMVVGALCLVIAAQAPAGARIGLFWPVLFHVFNNIGTAHIMPLGLALFVRLAPPALNATVVGVYYLTFFLANQAVGITGGWLGAMPATQFWLMHAASSAAGLVLFGVVRLVLGRQPPA